MTSLHFKSSSALPPEEEERGRTTVSVVRMLHVGKEAAVSRGIKLRVIRHNNTLLAFYHPAPHSSASSFSEAVGGQKPAARSYKKEKNSFFLSKFRVTLSPLNATLELRYLKKPV